MRLRYEPQTLPVRIDEVALVVAELDALWIASNVLFSARMRDEEPEPPTIETVIRAVTRVRRLPSEPALVRDVGAQSLVRARALVRQAHAGESTESRDRALYKRWVKLASTNITRIDFGSPLEMVITVPLVSAAAINSFVVLANAARRLNRSGHSFFLDKADFDAALAKREADTAEARLRRENALIGLEQLQRATAAQMPLDEGEAYIDDDY